MEAQLGSFTSLCKVPPTWLTLSRFRIDLAEALRLEPSNATVKKDLDRLRDVNKSRTSAPPLSPANNVRVYLSLSVGRSVISFPPPDCSSSEADPYHNR